MGVLRTNEDTFVEEANSNSYLTDQHYEFVIPERGANSYFQILPKNYAISQLVEDSVVHTLSHDDTDDGILQVFKANFDNINNLKFLTKGSFPDSEERIVIDNCEYPDNDDSARDAWVANCTDKIWVQSVDWEEYGGSYCLGMFTHSRAEGYYMKHTFTTTQDWSTLSAIDFMWQSEAEGSNSRWQLIVHDNIGQIATVDFSVDDDEEWENKHFNKSIFYNESVVDWSKIDSICFKNLKSGWSHWCYLDNLHIIKNVDNTHISSNVELIHLGSSINFSPNSKVTLDNNKDFQKFVIQNDNKRITPCKLQYGAKRNDWKLIQGDYYGLYIKKPDKGSITFYGSSTKKFASGDLYNVNGNSIEALNKSLAFMVSTFSDSKLKKLTIRQDVHSPKSNINLLLINSDTFEVEKFLGIYTFDASNKIEIEYDYSKPENIIVDKDSHLYVYYQDSQTSEASILYVNPRFHYEKIGD